jgi:hypothetical protein
VSNLLFAERPLMAFRAEWRGDSAGKDTIVTNRRSRKIRKLTAKTGMSYEKALELDRQGLASNANIATGQDSFDTESVVPRPASDKAADISFMELLASAAAGTLAAGFPDPAIGKLSAAFTEPVISAAAGTLAAGFPDPAIGKLSAAFTEPVISKLSAAFTDLVKLYGDGGLGHVLGADDRS